MQVYILPVDVFTAKMAQLEGALTWLRSPRIDDGEYLESLRVWGPSSKLLFL